MNKLRTYFTNQKLILLLIAFVFYGNTLRNGYALDDYIVTEKENITASGIKSIPKILRSYHIDRSEDVKFDYRPMVKISFAIEHELFGLNSTVSHFFNVLLYAIGLFVLLDFLTLLFSNYSSALVFYALALFAIMPIHSEVVASLKNRDVLLCLIFCIISFKNFLLFFENNKKWWLLLIGVITFYAAFLSKFDALPYLAIIPVLLFVKYRPSLKWFVFLIVLLIISFYLYKLSKHGIIGKGNTKRVYSYFENPLYFENDLKLKIIATFNCLGFYMNQIILPFKQCCYYGLDTISVHRLTIHGFIGVIVSPVLLFGLYKSFVKKNYFLFSGLFMFCASSSMYLNLVQPAVGIVADRFAFFSSIGLAITFISLLSNYVSLSAPLHNNIKISFAVLLVLFGTMTFSRNRDWKNIYTLVNADYTKYPNNVFLNYKQGLNIIKQLEDKNNPLPLELKKNKVLEAKKLIEKSVSVDSSYVVSQEYLSYVLVYLLNDFNAAIPHINSALKLKESTEVYFYKAICMRETKQKDSSEYYLLKCISRDKTYLNAYNLLMYDYNANREFEKTISLFNKAITDGFGTVEIYNGLGKTYWQMKNNSEANTYYQKALDLDPTNQEAAAMVKQTSIATQSASVK